MKIFRTRELEGFKTTPGKWEHLQQVWCVISERRTLQGRRKSGRKKKGEKPRWGKAKVMEKRFFVTNMPLNAMSPRQCLQAVRVHWGIEGTHWVTDTQWNEDDSPWCRKGEALLVLSLLRLMAYNMISWLKCRRIRNKTMRNWSWKDWFECLKEAMAVVIRFKRKSLGK